MIGGSTGTAFTGHPKCPHELGHHLLQASHRHEPRPRKRHVMFEALEYLAAGDSKGLLHTVSPKRSQILPKLDIIIPSSGNPCDACSNPFLWIDTGPLKKKRFSNLQSTAPNHASSLDAWYQFCSLQMDPFFLICSYFTSRTSNRTNQCFGLGWRNNHFKQTDRELNNSKHKKHQKT